MSPVTQSVSQSVSQSTAVRNGLCCHGNDIYVQLLINEKKKEKEKEKEKKKKKKKREIKS